MEFLLRTDALWYYHAAELQSKLRHEGTIKTLLGMARLGHSDVQAQVARGIANFAKCESHQTVQGETHFVFSSSQGLLIHLLLSSPWKGMNHVHLNTKVAT